MCMLSGDREYGRRRGSTLLSTSPRFPAECQFGAHNRSDRPYRLRVVDAEVENHIPDKSSPRSLT